MILGGYALTCIKWPSRLVLSTVLYDLLKDANHFSHTVEARVGAKDANHFSHRSMGRSKRCKSFLA